MSKHKKLTAKEWLAQLQDDLRQAIQNGDDTSDIRFDIEQARINVDAEEATAKLVNK